MKGVEIRRANSAAEARELDAILWEVLWRPLDLPRDFRESLERLDERCLEYVAREDDDLVGGLVMSWRSPVKVDLRHLAVVPNAQGRSIGRGLVWHLITEMKMTDCATIETVARSTSTGFFTKLGFLSISGEQPQHPDFLKHGIAFTRMKYDYQGIND